MSIKNSTEIINLIIQQFDIIDQDIILSNLNESHLEMKRKWAEKNNMQISVEAMKQDIIKRLKIEIV